MNGKIIFQQRIDLKEWGNIELEIFKDHEGNLSTDMITTDNTFECTCASLTLDELKALRTATTDMIEILEVDS